MTVATVEANANRYLTRSARASLTLAPMDAVRITPSLTYQALNVHDTSTFDTDLSDPPAGVLRNDSFRSQPFDNWLYLASLKVTAGLAGTDLSAVTSYFDGESNATLDGSTGPATLAAYYQTVRQREFTQELRLTSADAEARLAWLAGAFFSSNHTRIPDRYVGIVAYWNSPIPIPIDIGNETTIDKTSLEGFGDVSLKMTTRVNLSAGLRVGHTRFDGDTQLPPAFHAAEADTWTAPRFVLSYQGTPQGLLYLSAAKGYGSGGIYYAFTLGPDPPEAYTPDTLWSYEAGVKLDLDGGRVRLDGSIFHILWNNGPQVDDYPHGENRGLVPGSAVSNGFDLTAQASLTDDLLGHVAIAYTDARYTETTAVTYWYGSFVTVRAGDAVGFGSPWNVTAALEQAFFLGDGLACTLRVEDVFHSHNPRSFYEQDPQSNYYAPGWHPDPSINILNARATLHWSHFEVAAFVNNALNSQPSLAVTTVPDVIRGSWAHTVTPRTLGLSGTWRF